MNGSELRVAPSYDFKPGLGAKVGIGLDALEQLGQPGDKLNLTGARSFVYVRSQFEKEKVPYTGVHAEGSKYRAEDVPNPDSPSGEWDPYAYMPRFAFDPKEDAFPISPDFDGDTNVSNNAPSKPHGDGHYEDGVIGAQQPLTSGFSVAKKGGYTVLNYSFHYATNKAGDYHTKDYSTAAVYLKPGKGGKLEPAYLMTSWHHGEKLIPWSELKKDGQGKPIIGVDRGSHALNVLDEVPSEGLQVQGDGQAILNGKPVAQKLSFEAAQKNVTGARYLDPESPASLPRLRAMNAGAGYDPILPEVFEAQPLYWKQLVGIAEKKVSAFFGGLVDKTEGAVSGVWHKATGLFS